MGKKDRKKTTASVRCPRCRASFAVEASALHRVTAYHCVCCGAVFEVIPALSFLFGKTLSESGDGFPKLACPHCGQHYTVKSMPENAFVQCSRCLRSFALPPGGAAKPPRQVAGDDDRRCG